MIKLRMINRRGNCTDSFEVKIGADTVKFTYMMIAKFKGSSRFGQRK